MWGFRNYIRHFDWYSNYWWFKKHKEWIRPSCYRHSTFIWILISIVLFKYQMLREATKKTSHFVWPIGGFLANFGVFFKLIYNNNRLKFGLFMSLVCLYGKLMELKRLQSWSPCQPPDSKNWHSQLVLVVESRVKPTL